MALKSIDRMDIVGMLEGQPPQPARQGSRDPSRRPHEREHLSPGMTNGEFGLRAPLPFYSKVEKPLQNTHRYPSEGDGGGVWASSC